MRRRLHSMLGAIWSRQDSRENHGRRDGAESPHQPIHQAGGRKQRLTPVPPRTLWGSQGRHLISLSMWEGSLNELLRSVEADVQELMREPRFLPTSVSRAAQLSSVCLSMFYFYHYPHLWGNRKVWGKLPSSIESTDFIPRIPSDLVTRDRLALFVGSWQRQQVKTCHS